MGTATTGLASASQASPASTAHYPRAPPPARATASVHQTVPPWPVSVMTDSRDTIALRSRAPTTAAGTENALTASAPATMAGAARTAQAAAQAWARSALATANVWMARARAIPGGQGTAVTYGRACTIAPNMATAQTELAFARRDTVVATAR